MRGQEDSAIYFLVDAEILSAKLPEPNNLIILREVYLGYSGLCKENNEALYWLLKSKELYQQLDDIDSHPYATLISKKQKNMQIYTCHGIIIYTSLM